MKAHVAILLPTTMILVLFPTNRNQTPVPPTFFGMHVENPSHWPTVPFAALGKCTGTVWYIIQQHSRDEFNWQPIDRCLEAAESHSMSLFISTEGVPPWAAADPWSCYSPLARHPELRRCASTVSNMADWDLFIQALASRYKGRLIYELWNEPHLGARPEVGGIQDMVELTNHEYKIIREIDPHAYILAPSFVDTRYMDEYYARGGTTGIDAITFHGSSRYPEELLARVQEIRRIMAKYGMQNKPLWATEGGHWGRLALSPDEQAAFVGRIEMLFWSWGVARHYWYSWGDPTWGALWDQTNGYHPGAKAYQNVHEWMVGAVMEKPCSELQSIWTCGFARPGGYEGLAVWNTSGPSIYTAPSQYTQYRDLDGNVFAVRASVSIGPKPILLEKLAVK